MDATASWRATAPPRFAVGISAWSDWIGGTMPIRTRLTLPLLALLIASAQADAGIVGGWYAGHTLDASASVLILYDGGAYLHITGADPARHPSVRFDGYERGTYRFHEATGTLSIVTHVDTDGNRGLGALSDRVGAQAALSGDTLTLVLPGAGPVTFNRVAGPHPVVGAWGTDPFAPGSPALALLPDGTYFYLLTIEAEPGAGQRPVVRHARYAAVGTVVDLADDHLVEGRPADSAHLDVRFSNDVHVRLPRIGAPAAAAHPWDGYTAIEYHHAGYQHHFVTASGDEIAKLDRGEIAGWARTGNTFRSAPPWDYVLAGACRFASVRFAKPTHFHTTFADECAALQHDPDWAFEGLAFDVYEAYGGGCPVDGTVPLFRLYNGGRGGVANHRLTADPGLRAALLEQGYIAEGVGPGIIGCVMP
jgi:hypothetical protein